MRGYFQTMNSSTLKKSPSFLYFASKIYEMSSRFKKLNFNQSKSILIKVFQVYRIRHVAQEKFEKFCCQFLQIKFRKNKLLKKKIICHKFSIFEEVLGVPFHQIANFSDIL